MADAVTQQVLQTRNVSDHVLKRLFEVHPFQPILARREALKVLRGELEFLVDAADSAIDEINYELNDKEYD